MRNKIRELYELLASVQHQIWASWMTYLFSKCEQKEEGLLIPQNLVDRWQGQIDRGYDELTEKEKDSDREQVDKFWQIIGDFWDE